MKKTMIVSILIVSLLLLAVPAAAGEAASLVEDLPTVQAYLDEPVSEDELIKS